MTSSAWWEHLCWYLCAPACLCASCSWNVPCPPYRARGHALDPCLSAQTLLNTLADGKDSLGTGTSFQWKAHTGSNSVKKNLSATLCCRKHLLRLVSAWEEQPGPCRRFPRPPRKALVSSRGRGFSPKREDSPSGSAWVGSARVGPAQVGPARVPLPPLCRVRCSGCACEPWPGSCCLKPIIISVILTGEGTDLQSFFLVRHNHQPDLSCLAEIHTQ